MSEGRAVAVMWKYVTGLGVAVNAEQSEAFEFLLFSSLNPSSHSGKRPRSESSFMNSTKLFS